MPKEKEFLEIKDQESLMLNGIINKYNCIRQNNIIRVFSEEINKVLSFTVLKTEPAEIISLINTDLEVDFKIPPAFLKPIKNAVETTNSDKIKPETENKSIFSEQKIVNETNNEINNEINNETNNETNNEINKLENIKNNVKLTENESLEETEEQFHKKREEVRLARLAFFENKTL